MSTSGYFAPYIDATGFHIPTYAEILAYEQEQFLAVYGQSADMGNSNADSQWVSIFSLMINDAFNTAQLAINGRSPATAIGGDLDTIAKINGITRASATYSLANLTCSGIPLTPLPSAIAQDLNANLWTIPACTIGVGGSVIVTATCLSVGAITALAGTIIIRSTPIAGWNAVTNASDALPGNPTESDSALRARIAISVSLSAKTLVGSTLAAIAAVPGVTRYNPGVLSPTGTSTSVENPTGGVDYFGNPAHSISMVVEGGTALAIATAIYNNKCPGCFINGSTSTAVTDPVSGATMNIGWSLPTYIPIYVTLNVHALTGYTSATTALIQAAVVAYLNGLQIGESLTISGLYFAAMAVMPNQLLPQFSVQALYAATTATPTTSVDIPVNYNQVVSGSLANVVIDLV